MIETFSWVLPRPRRPFYPGGFPQWFEKKLLEVCRCDRSNASILHIFGGMAEFGKRMDIKAEIKKGGIVYKIKPDVIADAHNIPFKGNTFDLVIADPPYSNELSRKIYGTGDLVYKRWVAEAVRVCKIRGYVVLYHQKWLPRPPGTEYHKRIFLAVRIWQNLRHVGIFRKYGDVDDDR